MFLHLQWRDEEGEGGETHATGLPLSVGPGKEVPLATELTGSLVASGRIGCISFVPETLSPMEACFISRPLCPPVPIGEVKKRYDLRPGDAIQVGQVKLSVNGAEFRPEFRESDSPDPREVKVLPLEGKMVESTVLNRYLELQRRILVADHPAEAFEAVGRGVFSACRGACAVLVAECTYRSRDNQLNETRFLYANTFSPLAETIPFSVSFPLLHSALGRPALLLLPGAGREAREALLGSELLVVPTFFQEEEDPQLDASDLNGAILVSGFFTEGAGWKDDLKRTTEVLYFLAHMAGLIIEESRSRFSRREIQRRKAIAVQFTHDLNAGLGQLVRETRRLLKKAPANVASEARSVQASVEQLRQRVDVIKRIISGSILQSNMQYGLHELATIVESVEPLLRTELQQYPGKSMELSLYRSPKSDDFKVWCDEGYVRLVLEYLVTNAFKHGLEDYLSGKAVMQASPFVSVALARVEKIELPAVDRRYVVVAVKNNGRMIPNEELQKVAANAPNNIFDLDVSLGGSSGLGLYYVKALTMAHRGHVMVHSGPTPQHDYGVAAAKSGDALPGEECTIFAIFLPEVRSNAQLTPYVQVPSFVRRHKAEHAEVLNCFFMKSNRVRFLPIKG